MAQFDREAELDRLILRSRVSDTVIRYATGVDTRDWALYRSAFDDELVHDFSSWQGEAGRCSADEWVAAVRQTLSGFDATQHLSTNHVVTLDGEGAVCVSYMIAHHVLVTKQGDNSFTLGGFYRNKLRQVGGDWKIYDCKLTVTWASGNRHLFEIAAARAK
jgi:hypothetical protein